MINEAFRNPFAAWFLLLAAWCLSPLAQADPTFINAADPELPSVARGIPMGGALQVFGLVLDQVGPADLDLERFEVFDPDAQLIVDNQYTVEPPADAYFRGRVAALPESIVVLAIPEKGPARGVITDSSGVWLLAGKSGHSAPGLANRKVDLQKELAGKPFECGTEGLDLDVADLMPADEADEPSAAALPVAHTARVAVETDYEYYAMFGNVNAASQYMADLFAYASTVYEREVDTNLVISWSRLWTGGATSDPWNAAGSTSAALYEFRDYWSADTDPDLPSERTIAHMLSGKPLGGGIGYVGVLCYDYYGYNTDYDFGLSASLGGNFNINSPSVVWDLLVVTHEIGHNFNSPHTQDYCGIGGNSDPVDLCYDSANGCGSALGLPGVGSLSGGTTAEKPGTIMSYCHQVWGGYSNISFTFGQDHSYGIDAFRVPNVMKAHVANRAATFPSCLPPEVACTVDADCDNGLFCDGDEVCNAGNCEAGTPPVCDDGLFCNGTGTCNETTDSCDSGAPPDIDDGVACTVDSCDEDNDQVVHAPNDLLCDNGVFCDGAETCDAINDCQAGTPPADDGVGCTDDSCDEVNDQVAHTPNNANCDNGLFCDGAETCDAINDCQAGSDPCSGQSCDDVDDVCVPLVCNNNGVCDGGENCFNCAQDCIGGTYGAVCGNNVCEAGDGENGANCPADCNAKLDGKPSRRFSCGFNDGYNPVGCGDDRCNSGGFTCTEIPVPAGDYCCGDGTCEGPEDYNSCAVDQCVQPPPPEVNCSDGVDNDSDGQTDCADSDCAEDPACQASCGLSGASCSSSADCCSNKCKGKPGRKTCG